MEKSVILRNYGTCDRMKKKQIVLKTIMLLFVAFFMFGATKVDSEAASKRVTTAYNKELKTLDIAYKNKLICRVPYKKEIVYAYVDLTYVRRGPGSQYDKKTTNSIKKDMGQKVLRVGVTKNKWAIVVMNKKYYYVKNKYLSLTKPTKKLSVKKWEPRSFKRKGVLHWNGWRWTWYSQRRLPGHGLKIPGRHLDKSGYVCDKDGYICLASGRLRKGRIVRTPLGKKGKVYDSGCGRNTLDVYTNF